MKNTRESICEIDSHFSAVQVLVKMCVGASVSRMQKRDTFQGKTRKRFALSLRRDQIIES